MKMGINKYNAIGIAFEEALGNIEIKPCFKNAIRIMRGKPELSEKIRCWNETMWSCVEEFLNAGLKPENEESFIHACALLEAQEEKK
jgi:hypothetical protein